MPNMLIKTSIDVLDQKLFLRLKDPSMVARNPMSLDDVDPRVLQLPLSGSVKFQG